MIKKLGGENMNKKLFTWFLIGTSLTSVFLLNTASVKASDISYNNGVVTTVRIASLYNSQGKLITNRALAANTPWATNRRTEIDNAGTVYQVATDEYVKASDVTLQHGKAAADTINAGINGALIYNYQDGKYVATNSKLDAYSKWQYNYTDNVDGKTWYQVATNTWINSDDASTASFIKNTGVAEISYAPDAGTDVWQGYGDNKKATGQKLANNTNWRFTQKVIDANGDSWYEIGNDQWISGAFTKVTNETFDETAAKNWDPNYAALKVTKDSGVYSDSSYSSSVNGHIAAGKVVEVDSTVQDGNTIWYEMSNGGWLPSSNVTPITTTRSKVVLNGQTKDQAIEAVIAAAKQQLGKPYVWNGKGPDNFDCSGLMQYVFRQVTGQNIGAWTVPQETAGTKVSMNDIKRGALIFWGNSGASYHVALYLGNNEYLNALRPGTNVKTDSISSSFAPSFGVRIF